MSNDTQEDIQQRDVVKYATWRLTLLELMGGLALFGIILTIVLRYFFA